MSAIDSLTYKTFIDSTGWTEGTDKGLKALDLFDAKASKKLESFSMGSMPSMESKDMGADFAGQLVAIGPQIASSLAPIGEKIAVSLKKAVVPIASIGTQISKQLDAQFRFDRLRSAISLTKNTFKSATQSMEADASFLATKVDQPPFASGWKGGLQRATASFKSTLEQWGKDYDNFDLRLNHLKEPALTTNLRKTNLPKLGSIKVSKKDLGDLGSPSVAAAPMRAIVGATRSATGALGGFAAQALAAFGVFALGYKAVTFLKDGVKGASDLNETLSKTDQVLGSGSDKVKGFADSMASQFGLVKRETLDAASGFAGLGKSLGNLRGEKLADFSIQFTKLAADLSSFSNIDFGQASQALNTSLAGNQSDTLKALGVVVNETTVKQYAMAHGIGTATGELTEQQKVMARAGLIAQGLADVTGDLDRTAGGTANQWRKLTGTIENLGVSIGQALLPAITVGVGYLNEFTSAIYNGFEASKAVVGDWVVSFQENLDVVGAVVRNWPASFEVARLFIYEKLVNIGEYFEVLGPNIVRIGQWAWSNFFNIARDYMNGILTLSKNLWSNISALGKAIGEFFADPTKGFEVEWTPLLDGFVATTEALPELLKPSLTDMSKDIEAAAAPIIDDIAKRMAARRAALAAPKRADITPGVDTPEVKKEVELKFSGALELGSKEAYSALAQAQYGQARPLSEIERHNRLQVLLQQSMDRSLKDIATKTGGMMARVVNI